MSPASIQSIQSKLGVTPDGIWGPKSAAACRAHLLSLMPQPRTWPAQTAEAMTAFYGQPGDEANLVPVAAPFPMFFEGQRVKSIRVHKLCSQSLLRALRAAYEVAPEIVSVFDGCYNFRKIRGGSALSIHSWGAAIDLAADHNANHSKWPQQSSMPLEVMECFAREGWFSAGAFWGRDAMHFSATC